jgi:hypothetical protein
LFGGRITVHKEFSEDVKIDGMILSRLIPSEILFKSLEEIAQDHGIRMGAHPFKAIIFTNTPLP